MSDRNTPLISVRMLKIEDEAIRDACAAWKTVLKISPSQLMVVAAAGEAQAMGFRPETYEDGQRPKLSIKWGWEPDRGEESLQTRFTLSVSPIYLRSIEQAARAVGTQLQDFFVGAALKFIRTRQQFEPTNRALQKIVLPPKYRV
jgi:hypothetical protein